MEERRGDTHRGNTHRFPHRSPSFAAAKSGYLAEAARELHLEQPFTDGGDSFGFSDGDDKQWKNFYHGELASNEMVMRRSDKSCSDEL
ncbi:unnamed protein product [Cuscuta campestris]|uniref:Uncharacterized protein n=1 Tax=Cuscuta campestris TaxID=132261 RepID=A0A484LU28_9ASTE|nr:unnamed protein product [Cuscuta campestris]